MKKFFALFLLLQFGDMALHGQLPDRNVNIVQTAMNAAKNDDSLKRIIRKTLGIKPANLVINSTYSGSDLWAFSFLKDTLKDLSYMSCESDSIFTHYKSYKAAIKVDSIPDTVLVQSATYNSRRKNLVALPAIPYCNTLCCEFRVYSGPYIGETHSYYKPVQLFVFFYIDKNGLLKYLTFKMNQAPPTRLFK